MAARRSDHAAEAPPDRARRMVARSSTRRWTASSAEKVKAATKEAEKNGILGHGLHHPFHTMFEDVFEELPWHLEEQAAQAIRERQIKWPRRERRMTATTCRSAWHDAPTRRMNMIEAINDALDIMLARDPDVVMHGRGRRLFRRRVPRHRRPAGEARQDPRVRHADQRMRDHRRRRWAWAPMACARCPRSSSPITSIPGSTS